MFIKLVNQFVNKIKFVGVGIKITEEMRIVVAGWAVLLVLNRPLNINWYQNIETISIHPGKDLKSGGVLGFVEDGYSYCHVHFPWQHIRDDSTKATNNENTILHEFAHALDHVDRLFDGCPEVMLSKNENKVWRKTFNVESISLWSIRKRKKFWQFFGLGKWHEFDPDNTIWIDMAEIFAVTTEMFFEAPDKLINFSPGIYHCLRQLYGFNPIV